MTEHGGGRERSTLFRDLLAAAGPRALTTTLSRSTLLALCHAVEDLLLADEEPGALIAGFQGPEHADEERERYASIAAPPQRTVVVFSTGVLQRSPGVRQMSVPAGHPLAAEWFVLVLTERFCAAVFAHELADQSELAELDRRYVAVWTFDPAVVGDLLEVVTDVATDVDVEAAATLRDAVRRWPPVATRPRLALRVATEVFERIEASRPTSARDPDAVFEQLAGQIAHEINNPLATITMAASLLEGSASDPESRQLAGLLEQQALRAGRLARDLQLWATDVVIAPHELALTQVLRIATEELRNAGHDVVVDAAPGVMVAGDLDLLGVALANLGHHAAEADGRREPVRIAVELDDDGVEVAVHDDGTPLPEAVLEVLFTPFAERAALRRGSGLGLPVARRLLAAHGAQLTVASEDTGGTVARFRLPARVPADGTEVPRPAVDTPTGDHPAPAEATAAPIPPPPPGAAGVAATPPAPAATTPDTAERPTPPTTADPAQRRILVLDDDAAIRGLLEALLRRDGWQVRCVGSGEAAIRAVTDQPVDVVLIDVQLVAEKGTVVLASLDRVQPGLRDRAAFVTGDPPDDRQIEGRPVLAKPFVWRELAALLERLHQGS